MMVFPRIPLKRLGRGQANRRCRAGRRAGKAVRRKIPRRIFPRAAARPEAGRATSEPPEEMAEALCGGFRSSLKEAAAGSPAGGLEANAAEQAERPSSGSGSETGNVPEAAAGAPLGFPRCCRAASATACTAPVAPANAVPPPAARANEAAA